MKASLLVLASALIAVASASAAHHEWIDLFDGESFDGWTFDVLDDSDPSTIWSIEDETIMVRGKGKSNGVIRTEKEYGDYILEFEWRWPGDPGNSGLLIHCSTPRQFNAWPTCLEVQLWSGDAGDFINLGEEITTLESQIPTGDIRPWEWRRRLNLTDDSEKPAGEWNRMRAVVTGNQVAVYVNGDLVNLGWQGTATEGAICLQAEKADIQFRKIRLLPLK